MPELREHGFDKAPWRRRNIEFILRNPGVLGTPERRRAYVELAGDTAGESYRAMRDAGLVDKSSFLAMERDLRVSMELERSGEHRTIVTRDACEKLLRIVKDGSEDVGVFNFDSQLTAKNGRELSRSLSFVNEVLSIVRGGFILISNVALRGDVHGGIREYRKTVLKAIPDVDPREMPSDEEILGVRGPYDVQGTKVGPAEVYRSEDRRIPMLTSRHYFPARG